MKLTKFIPLAFITSLFLALFGANALADNQTRPIPVVAGTGLSKTGNTLSVNIVGGACAAGQSVTSISATGTASCSANVSSVASGNGINAPTTSGTTTVSVNNGTGLIFATGALTYDNTIIQSRVSGTCTSPNAIASVSATGTVTCTTGVLNTANVSGTTTDLAVFTGTNSVGNFAGSSPAACAAGQVLTRVTSAATGVITLTCTAIGTAGGTTGTGTTNTIPKWTSASGLGNSTITDAGTGTVATSSQFSISRAAGSAPLLDFAQVGQTDWQLYEHGSASTFALWNSTVAGDITAWDSAGNMTQGLNLSVLGSTILGDTVADSTLVNGTLHEIQTSGSAGLVFGTSTKDWTWYLNGTTAALHEYTGTLGGGGGTDWLTIAAGGATTLNGLTTIQNSGTSTTIVPLALTRTDVATVGDVTELDIGQQTAQAKIYTSTTNAGDLSATLNMSVRWFNGTDYNNSDFSMGAGGETFSATNPGGPDELDVRNRSNVASTTTRIATGDGTGYLFSILSDNAGSTTKLMATDRNTAMEFWTGAGGGAKAIGIDGSQNVTVTNLATTAGNVDVWGTNWHSILNWTGSTNQDTYIRAGVTAGNVWIGDVNTGGVGLGAAGNTTTVYGPLTSTAGANTLGETEDNMTTASNSSGTLTDISFDRRARGVWWTITGGLTVDGFGFTSGTPTDGQKFKICVIGGGSLVALHENAGETTAGRRFNFQINGSQVLRSGGCWDFTYEDAGGVGGKRWHRSENGIASFNLTANAIPKYTGNYELQSSSLTDNGTTVVTTEGLQMCTGCVQSSSITSSNTSINAGSTAGTISFGTANTGGITIGQNTNALTINSPTTHNYSAAAAAVDKDTLDVNNTSTWNTTAAVHATYGVHVSCANSISSGTNTLTSTCGYFSNTSSGANINAWALLTDTGNVKFNATSGTFEVVGTASFDNTVNITGALTTNAVIINGGASVAGGLTSTTSESFNNSTFNGNLSTTTGTHVIDKDGASRPTIANCGTTAPTVVGNDVSGFFVTATGITSSCAITFHQAYGSNVDCNSWITGAGTTVSHPNLTIATTGLTFAGSSGPLGVGLKVHYECKDH